MSGLSRSAIDLPWQQRAIRSKCFHPTGIFTEFKKEDIEQSIPVRFEYQVYKYPDRLAVKTKNHRFTYEALNKAANCVAQAILAQQDRGVEPVALLLDHDAPMIFAILGVLKAGKIYVPLDPSYPRTRISYMLEDSQSGLLVTNNRYLSMASELAQGALQLINIDALDSSLSAEDLNFSLSPDIPAWILYTSGSTGQPKGIVQNHRNVLHFIMNYTNSLHISPEDRLSLLASSSHSAAAMDTFGALLNGAVLYPFDIKEEGLYQLANWLIREEITIYHSASTVFRHFLDTLTGQEQFPKLRVIDLGGDSVYKRDVERYKKYFAPDCILVNGYGITELNVVRQYFIGKNTKVTSVNVPVGYAVEDKEILLLDDSGEQVGPNHTGEIVIKSPYLSPGYWRQPDLTREAFISDPAEGNVRLYRTGDLGCMLPDDCLVPLGRKDFQVKIRGHRIEIAEIEMALLNVNSIKQAAVLAWEDGSGGRRLVAYVVLAEKPAPTINIIRRALLETLPDYMIPSAFVFLDTLPLTPNGKIDRHALPIPDQAHPELEEAFVAPRTPVEKVLAVIFSEVLGLERVGIHHSFFELGGHSLAATQLISKVRDAFQVELSLRSLFEMPTVAGMAVAVAEREPKQPEQKDAVSSLPTIEPAPDQRYLSFPLTDVQQAYWIGRSGLFDLGDVSSHLYMELDCVGVNLERLNLAWQLLIERHDMLRAIVLPDGRQQILEGVSPYQIVVLDLRGQDPQIAASQLETLRERMSHQVLPSDRWPLFEIRATRLEDQRLRLHFSFDALVLDAASRFILFSEWSQLYENPDTLLAPLKISFRDCVLAEIALRDSDLYHRSRDYWWSRLPTLLPAPELPLAKSSSSVTHPRFACRSARLEPEAWLQLKSRASQTDLTPSAVLLAAFAEVLKVWSKSPRFTLNLTHFHRPPLHPQVNDIVGDFTSLILLAVDNSALPTFEARARRLQEQLWADMDHRYMSGVQVLRELARRQRGASRAAMPVVFTSILPHHAYSTEFCHLFRRKVATQSTGKLPPPIGAERRGVVYG